MERKLTAILSADVHGYSRLMGRDEEATVQRLLHLRALIARHIKGRGGRVVDAPGDNILAEFPSAVEALACAAGFQREILAVNAPLAPNRRMLFRVGINIGDVLADEGRIYGDGVNIAARIEKLADPGGICISRGVYDQVHQKIALAYRFIGEKRVKNISEPVRVYKVEASSGPMPGARQHRDAAVRSPRRYGRILALIALAGVALWFGHRLGWPPLTDERSAPARPQSASSTKPSIAVMPFQHLGLEEPRDYFSEGITSDIITDLSKFAGLAVIASNTVLSHAYEAKDDREIGRELDVDYILRGSVQKQADLVRLNATLVDGRQGRHIWAERYERRLEDVFGVQDELVQTIVGKMAIQINAAETAKVWRKPPQAYSAYEYLLKGRFLYRQRTRPANFEARQLYRKALDIAPRDVEAMVGLGWTYIREMYDGWSEFPNRAISKAQELAHGALAVDETSAGAHELLAECYLNRRQFKLAMAELDRSLELNPNAAHSLKAYGSLLFYRGDTGRSIRMFERALRLDPHLLTTSRSIYMELGLSHYLEENYADALHILNQGVSRRPDFAGNHIGLAATHAQLGDMAQARHHAEVVRKQLPFFNLNDYGTKFMQAEDRARIVAGLEKAGL